MLLLTRPAKQAAQDVKFFNENSIACLSAPMLDIRQVPYEIPLVSSFDCLIFTSGNAVEFLSQGTGSIKNIYDVPVIAVGDQTALSVEDAGFKNVHSVSGTAKDIVDFIIGQNSDATQRFLYVRGVDIRMDICAELEMRDIACDSLIVYQSALADTLSEDTVEMLKSGKITMVTFLSPRTAINFEKLVRVHKVHGALKHTKALCISDSVLECVRVLDWKSTHVSSRPDGDAMKDLILSLYPT